MQKRVIMIHGWGGWPEEGWRPWLRQKLEAQGYDVQIPAMPDTNHPKYLAWVEVLERVVGESDAPTILVGHSLGCITILRYLEGRCQGRIAGAVFVAGFFENLSSDYAEIYPFTDHPLNWEKIREHCPRFSVIHAPDDDVVNITFAEHLAEKLEVPVTLDPGKGHFSGDDGILEAPSILGEVHSIGSNV